MDPKMATIDDTISNYKNKFNIDLYDEPDETVIELQKLKPASKHGQSSQDDDDSCDLSDRELHYSSEEEDDARIRRSKLPKDLSGLMGQANLSFARGDTKDALFMCQEVIRLAPNCPDPFISLAEHFLEEGDEEKSEQLYLIAGYLEPSNPNSWVKVAEFATKRGEFKLAASCFTKAIRAHPSIHYHLNRCNLYEKLGDQKRALRGYESLVSALGPDDEKFGLELARGIARIYLADNKIDSSIRTLEKALLKYSSQLNAEDIEQLSKSYNMTQNYMKTIDTVQKHCGIKITVDSKDWDLNDHQSGFDYSERKPKVRISIIEANKFFSLKNRCLLIVALISIGYHDETIKELLDPLETIDLVKYRDSLYEISRAYFNLGAYASSKKILYKLTGQRDSQIASIWLLYSQCLKNLDEIDEAILGYKKVIDLNPDDFSSRLALSNLLNVKGRVDEALDVSKQTLFTKDAVDIPLLYQSSKLLQHANKWNEYCNVAKALLLTDMTYTQHPREIMCMITSRSMKTRLENLRAIQRELNTTNNFVYTGEKLDHKTLIEVFLEYIRVLLNIKVDYQELRNICFSAYTSPSLEFKVSSLDYYSVMACICSNNLDYTYTHLKIIVSQNPDNNQAWNLFSLAMTNIYQDLRHSRFCVRLVLKNPDVAPLALLNGHNALMSGSYKHALGEYMTVFKDKTDDPLTAFCIALTFLSLSCQRYVSNKYLCLFQMIAFLQTYSELRGTCQETLYNIARAFHQINMVDKAVIFYKKVLSYKRVANRIEKSHETKEDFDEIFNLQREAAFNLALIYKNSQSDALAYQVINEYFTI